MPALTPFLQSLADLLAQQKMRAESLADLTPEQWNWSPDKETWSIGQVVHHLRLSGDGIVPRFQSALEEMQQGNQRSDAAPRLNFLERQMLRFVSPNPPFRVPVPPGFEPSLTPEPKEIALSAFLRLHDDLQEILLAANGYDLTTIHIESPASRLIKPRFGAYLAITLQHQEYHGLQVDTLRTQFQ